MLKVGSKRVGDTLMGSLFNASDCGSCKKPHLPALALASRLSLPSSLMMKKPKERSPPPFDTLSDDLVLLILTSLAASAERPQDLISMRLTSRRMFRLASQGMVLQAFPLRALKFSPYDWVEGACNFLFTCSQAGNKDASYSLGMIAFYSMQKPSLGVRLLARAAVLGSADAYYSLAIIHFNGSGGSKENRDEAAGALLCAQAASMGHTDALREMGHCMQDGYGVPMDPSQGRKLLLKANFHDAVKAFEYAAHMASSSGPRHTHGTPSGPHQWAQVLPPEHQHPHQYQQHAPSASPSLCHYLGQPNHPAETAAEGPPSLRLEANGRRMGNGLQAQRRPRTLSRSLSAPIFLGATQPAGCSWVVPRRNPGAAPASLPQAGYATLFQRNPASQSAALPSHGHPRRQLQQARQAAAQLELNAISGPSLLAPKRNVQQMQQQQQQQQEEGEEHPSDAPLRYQDLQADDQDELTAPIGHLERSFAVNSWGQLARQGHVPTAAPDGLSDGQLAVDTLRLRAQPVEPAEHNSLPEAEGGCSNGMPAVSRGSAGASAARWLEQMEVVTTEEGVHSVGCSCGPRRRAQEGPTGSAGVGGQHDTRTLEDGRDASSLTRSSDVPTQQAQGRAPPPRGAQPRTGAAPLRRTPASLGTAMDLPGGRCMVYSRYTSNRCCCLPAVLLPLASRPDGWLRRFMIEWRLLFEHQQQQLREQEEEDEMMAQLSMCIGGSSQPLLVSTRRAQGLTQMVTEESEEEGERNPCSFALCGRVELRAHEFRCCAVCMQARYCSRACQSQDWRVGHKAACFEYMHGRMAEQHGL